MYAELGTFIHVSGGEWAYLREGFGSVPSFLFSWMTTLLLKPASISIIALACGEYIMVAAYPAPAGCAPHNNDLIKMVAAAVICEY